MQEGLETSTYLILCYSSSDVLVPWISREWMSALARQMNGANVKVLPVILTVGKPPAILSDVQYADLTKNWSEAVKSSLRAIK